MLGGDARSHGLQEEQGEPRRGTSKSWVWEVTVALLPLQGTCPCCGEGTGLAGRTWQGEPCRSCRTAGLVPDLLPPHQPSPARSGSSQPR